MSSDVVEITIHNLMKLNMYFDLLKSDNDY